MKYGTVKLEIDLVSKTFVSHCEGYFTNGGSPSETTKYGIAVAQGTFSSLTNIVVPSGATTTQQRCQVNKYTG